MLLFIICLLGFIIFIVLVPYIKLKKIIIDSEEKESWKQIKIKTKTIINKYKTECYNSEGKLQNVIYWRKKNEIGSGNASIPCTIALTGNWYVLGYSHEIEWEKALITTLGHELGHKSNEPKQCYFNIKKKFINYVREVRADFYGLEFAKKCGINREEAIKTIKMKVELKKKI